MSLAGTAFFARIVENSLRSVPPALVRVGRASGASPLQLIRTVQLGEATPSIIGGLTINTIAMIEYSAIAGTIGAPGVGYLAITYGYQRFDHAVMIATIVVLVALVASVLLAQRSLHQHVARVRDAFAAGGLEGARRAVAMIVGRDPDSLDAAGVSRAAIESCAENFADGVVAPAFWFALLGLPGLAAYKAVNTADSMIGHRTPRHEAFGWAAARLDDLVNLVPARLAGALVALAGVAAGGRPARALRIMVRDAPRHRSPNAGWPESAMAAALGLALAGPRRYGPRLVDDPFLNPQGRRDAGPADIGRSLRVLVAACTLHGALYAALVLLALLLGARAVTVTAWTAHRVAADRPVLARRLPRLRDALPGAVDRAVSAAVG